MNYAEAKAVIEAKNNRSRKRRQVGLCKQDLEAGHKGDNKTTNGRRARHFDVFVATFGNVVLAVGAGVIGDAQGDQFGILAPVLSDIVALAFITNQPDEQIDNGRVGRLSIRALS